MAIKRNPDGIPVDIPSTKPSEHKTEDGNRSSSVNVSVNLTKSNPEDLPTVITGRLRSSEDSPSSRDTKKRSRLVPDDDPTLIDDDNETYISPTSSSNRLIADAPTEIVTTVTDVITGPLPKPAATAPVTDEKTVIAGRNTPTVETFSVESLSPKAHKGTTQFDAMQDPLAGWLVVIDGPGQGQSLKIGYGQNSIGRGIDERISVNFGDKEISRNNHAVVTYDPRSKQFYLQPGAGTNLIYLDEQPIPVLQPQILAPFSHISIGKTTLRFVPFCSEHFHWE